MDLLLEETLDGGDLIVKGLDLETVSGWQNAPYLALFGGNPAASTTGPKLENEEAFDYWGNYLFFPNNPDAQFNSETERTLREVSLTPNGRLRIEEAVKTDLAFMRDFAEIEVNVQIIAVNTIQINILISEPGNLQNQPFQFIWDATKEELTEGVPTPTPNPPAPTGDDVQFSDGENAQFSDGNNIQFD